MIRWFFDRLAYVATLAGMKAGCLGVRFIPQRYLFRFSDSIATLAFYVFHGFRTRSIRNITSALGETLGPGQIEETVRKSLRNFFRACVEIAIALEASSEEHRASIPIQGREHLDTALAKGNGVIVLSAHLGNFFLVGKRLAAEGYPVHVLVNQPRYGRFADLMDYYRLRVGQKTIHARPRHEALREVVQVLRKNELAVIIADEYRTGNGICVPFFGRMVLARRGPATLALRTGAAVVPICLIREPNGNMRLVIEPELELIRSNRSKAEVRENTSRVTQWVEKTIKTYPDQWNWMIIQWQDANDALVAKEHRFKELTH